MAKLQPKLQTCSSSIQKIHLGHLAGLDAVDDVDVGFHRFVVGVAGPFHHDVGRDAPGEGLGIREPEAGLISGIFRLSNHRSPIFTENAPDTLRGIFRGDKQIFRRTPKA